jgi:hypothetical protein
VVDDEVRLADGIRLGLEAEGCAVDDTALLLTTAAPDTAQNDPDGMVSEIGDKRIEEASGLALSMKHDDLVRPSRIPSASRTSSSTTRTRVDQV